MNLLSIKNRSFPLKTAAIVVLLVAAALTATAVLSSREHPRNDGHVRTIQTSHNPLTNSSGLFFLPIVTWPAGVAVEIKADFQVDGQGENIDSIAFWEAPDAAETLMFVTAKNNQLVEVWQYPFVDNELPPLRHASFGTVARVNGVAVDQERDRLYIVVAAPESTASIFSLPDLTFIEEFIAGAVDLESEPNVTLLEHANNQSWLYISSEESVYIHNALTGTAIGDFEPSRGLETMIADNFYQTIYIPDESDRTGLYVYQPDGTPYSGSGANNFGGSAFDDDAEGIILYTCPADGSQDDGTGFIIVADQREDRSDFEFFDRRTWEHLATLNIEGVSNTDGIGSTQRSLPGYPLGIFAAVHDDTSVAGVGWHVVLNALGFSCPSSARTEAPTANNLLNTR